MLTKNILGVLVAVSLVIPAMGQVTKSSQKQPTNWVPFPWAQALPFTWSTAQGVWTVGSSDAASYFYIRVTKDKANKAVKYLSITERDRATCTIVATGFGTEETDKRIVAEMKYTDYSKSRYRMMLRLYDPASVPRGQNVQPFKGKVMVLTIIPQGSNNSYNYPMAKVSDRTEYPCTPIK